MKDGWTTYVGRQNIKVWPQRKKMVVQLPNHATDDHQDGRNELTMLPAMPSVVIPTFLTYLANKVGEMENVNS